MMTHEQFLASHKKSREKHKEKNKLKAKAARDANPAKVMWEGARTRSRMRGLPFNLEQSDVVIPDVCPVLSIPLHKGSKDNTPHLDRFIPELGYVKGNVQVISGRANRIKYNASLKELRMIVEWMESK